MTLICGINPVMEALAARDRHFDRLLVVKGIRNRRVTEAMSQASQLGIPLRFEARETMDRMAGGANHQGLIAVVSAKEVLSLPDLLREVRDPALLVVLDGVEDPRNLGAILRTAEAAGADGVILPERRSAGLTDSVVRASSGAVEYVRVARVGNLVQGIESLKQAGIWIVGLDAAGTDRWDALDYNRPVALVLGGEGRGIRRLVREHCDHLVALPLFGHVGSLNVSVAAGVGLYEVIRQRRAVPSQVRPIPLKPASSQQEVVAPSPDDTEADPGSFVTRPPHPGSPEEADEDESPGPRLLIDEENAWAGPILFKAVEGPRRRRRPGRPGRAPGPPAGGQARADRRDDARESTVGGERRRRRRRRRRAGAPDPAGEGAAPRSEAPPPRDPANPNGGGRPGRRRRRRRRR